jgi:hypothetical protein
MAKKKEKRSPVLAANELVMALAGLGFMSVAIAAIAYTETVAPALERLATAWTFATTPGRG